MKELLKKLEKAEQETIALDLRYEEELEKGKLDKDLEAKCDEAYKTEYNLYIQLAEKIVEKSKKEIDLKTAKAIIKEKRDELKSIIQKMA